MFSEKFNSNFNFDAMNKVKQINVCHNPVLCVCSVANSFQARFDFSST